MDYLGHNQYFVDHYELDNEDDVQIEEYLSVEHFLDHQNMPDLDQFPFDEDKKLESTLELTDEINVEPPPPPSPAPAEKATIIFQQKTVDRYKEIYKGTKDDTVQLNINFKTLLVHYFRELKMLNELNEYQVKHVSEFSDRVPSFNSLMVFFQNTPANQAIRQRSLELFSSQECIKRIMIGRSKMKNKLQMIKFIEKVRLNILTKGKGYKWKDYIKKEL